MIRSVLWTRVVDWRQHGKQMGSARASRSSQWTNNQSSRDGSKGLGAQVTYRQCSQHVQQRPDLGGSPARYATVSGHANPSVLAAKGGSQRQSGTREWIFKKRRWREHAAFQATHSIRTFRNQTLESLIRKFETHQCRMGGSMWERCTSRHCSTNI